MVSSARFFAAGAGFPMLRIIMLPVPIIVGMFLRYILIGRFYLNISFRHGKGRGAARGIS